MAKRKDPILEAHSWFVHQKSFPKKLQGKWIAIYGAKVLAVGKDAVDLAEKADKIADDYLIARVPSKKHPFGCKHFF